MIIRCVCICLIQSKAYLDEQKSKGKKANESQQSY